MPPIMDLIWAVLTLLGATIVGTESKVVVGIVIGWALSLFVRIVVYLYIMTQAKDE